MRKATSILIIGVVMAGLIQNHATAADATQLQVDYNIGTYAGYHAKDYIVDLHGPFDGKVYDTAFNVSYVNGQPLPDGCNDSFISFCMDLKTALRPDGDWNAIALGGVNTSQLGYSFGISSLNRAANLYGAYVSTVNFSSQTGEINGGALQLAIWDVLYGNDVNAVNDAASSFYTAAVGRDSAAAIAQANRFLDSAANNPDSRYQAIFWEATDANGNPYRASNQDLIGPGCATGFVPEPGTFAAAAIAGVYVILSFGWSIARKQCA